MKLVIMDKPFLWKNSQGNVPAGVFKVSCSKLTIETLEQGLKYA